MGSDNKTNMLKNLSLLGYIGIVMVTPIIIGVYLGNFLDQYLHTENVFMILMTCIGVGAGFLNTYKVVMKDMNKKR
ncbi:MAG: AtpZ/AtpI family protein [Bacillota bacterium]